MNKNNVEFKPFRQIPLWNDNEEFKISGKELKAIEHISEAFSKFLPVLETILMRNLENGKITVRYEDLDGNELSKEEILAMYQKMLNHPPSQEPFL